MKKIYLLIALAILLTFGVAAVVIARNNTSDISQKTNSHPDKVYVAAEDSGDVEVIDSKSRTVATKIDLNLKQDGGTTMYMPHNVQVAPDGKSVWVTANVMSGDHTSFRSKLKNLLLLTVHANAGHGTESTAQDQLIVIDPLTDKITKRIDLGTNLHLAHVVLTPDSKYALATAQEKGAIYKVDTTTYQVAQTTATKPGDQPHGLRIAPDGLTAYIAMLGGKSIGKLDLQSATITPIPLNGAAVQTGVTPDGKYALATVYDGKSVAVYNTAQNQLEYVTLPAEAKGPLQLYTTPDSKYAFVADQGNYFGQPDGDTLYKIDLQERKVVAAIRAGSAPHGVVVSPDGQSVYVTNLVSNDVSIIDTVTNKEIAKISTGSKPNGISYWTKP